MIILCTGLPGNGKTLYTVAKAKEYLAHEGRTIYYAGINDLTLDWVPTDPETWYNLPVGSAIVIDEAQKYFRPLPNGAERPHKITAMETHRHKGMDLWLITQHPNLLDPHVRRLVGKHIHVHRTFGFGACNVWEWEEVEDPKDYHAKQRAVKSRFKFPKEVFTQYKSAEVHTVKRTIPWKLVIAPIAVAGAIGLAWFGYSTLKGSAEGVAKKGQQEPVVGSITPAAVPRQRLTARLEATKPDVPGLPHTAPRYDALTQVKAVPVVRGCFINHAVVPSLCWCVSQRGTRVETSREFCAQVVREGLPFYDFEPDKGPQDNSQHAAKVPPSVLPQSAESSVRPVSVTAPAPLGNPLEILR